MNWYSSMTAAFHGVYDIQQEIGGTNDKTAVCSGEQVDPCNHPTNFFN
jgi:hypothetical protein